MGTEDHPRPPSRVSLETVDELDDRSYFVVARGNPGLLDDLKAFLEELGWVRVIEDRRQEQTLLPREGREGKLYVA